MVRRKHEFARFCARVDRHCARMNSGLAAVVLVLAAMTVFVGSVQVTQAITRDQRLSELPFIEMSADSSDPSLWLLGD